MKLSYKAVDEDGSSLVSDCCCNLRNYFRFCSCGLTLTGLQLKKIKHYCRTNLNVECRLQFAVILCIEGVEEQTVNNLPFLICGSNLQQWRRAQLHTTGLIRWKHTIQGKQGQNVGMKSVILSYLNQKLCHNLIPSPSWKSFSSSGPSGVSGFTNAALK